MRKKKERRGDTKSERNGKKKPESEQRCRQNVRLKAGGDKDISELEREMRGG